MPTLNYKVVKRCKNADSAYNPERASNVDGGRAWSQVDTYLKKETEALEKVCDFGCGTGRYFASISSKELTGVDLSYHMIEKARANALEFSGDVLNLFVDDMVEFGNRIENYNVYDLTFSMSTFVIDRRIYGLTLRNQPNRPDFDKFFNQAVNSMLNVTKQTGKVAIFTSPYNSQEITDAIERLSEFRDESLSCEIFRVERDSRASLPPMKPLINPLVGDDEHLWTVIRRGNK